VKVAAGASVAGRAQPLEARSKRLSVSVAPVSVTFPVLVTTMR
jgi:hypothetical protein